MKASFYGWYLKSQSDTQMFAVIPAVHQNGKQRTCSIQLITDREAWNAEFSSDMFRKEGQELFIGANRFGPEGIWIDIQKPGLTVTGSLEANSLMPLRYDIMGPFAFLPFLECRHSVYSMYHSVNGTIQLNNQTFHFRNAKGYWEGDEGISFPKQYAWTHCFFDDGSLMLSVAEIPLFGFHFTGIIAVILWRGKEYRLATYLGAKIKQLSRRKIRIVQRNTELEITLFDIPKCPLKAPAYGDMKRTIQEGICCRAGYRFMKNGTVLFDFETDRASVEYEYTTFS